MKIKCIANSGQHLSKKQITFVNSPEYIRDFLKIGDIYTVYGITLVDNMLFYLIVRGQANSPTFQPAEFFEMVDNTIPPTWYYNYFGESKATWGYKELALNASHASDLENREEPEAFKIFHIRKNEIDEWIDMLKI